MLYLDTSTLGEPKDASSFRTHAVRAQYDANKVFLTTQPQELTFPQVRALRTNVAPTYLENALHQEDGHLLANVGVSANITLDYQGKSYLLLTEANRTDRATADIVRKLPSGYVPTRSDPHKHMLTEIAEEVLVGLGPVDDFELIPGVFQTTPLIRPYQHVRPYTTSPFTLQPKAKFTLPDMISDVALDGVKQEGVFQIDSTTNSGQIIYPFTMKLPEGPISLHYAEEKAIGENKLQTYVRPLGILLMELTQGKLTGDTYTLEQGVLVPYDKKANLTDAFAPKKRGIAQKQSISLEDYLTLHPQQ